MNRRGFLMFAAACCGAITPAVAAAPDVGCCKLRSSKLVVKVLSVDPQLSNRAQYSGGVTVETTKFIAKVQIEQVLTDEHGLSPGQTIEISYDVRVRQPPLPNVRDRGRLDPGETTTLSIAGEGPSRFAWIR
jgi:hypothetical protein